MSVRAYRIKKIDTADTPTFNVWHDNEIVDLAESNELTDGGGILSFNRETIDNEMKRMEKDNELMGDDKRSQEVYDILGDILKDMKKEDYVQYYCY